MAYIQLDCQSISRSLTKGKGAVQKEWVQVCVSASEAIPVCACILYMLGHGSIKAIRNV